MVPEEVRHKLSDRVFHWVMACLVITLLGTSFLPILGLKFNWVPIHWISGVLLILAVIFHLYRALLVHGIRTMVPTGDDLRSIMGSRRSDEEGKYDLNQNDLVVDLGSNDGTLLSGFKEHGIKITGVEPTNIAKIANKKNIETVQEFFTLDIAKNIKTKSGEASIILATNMFAHMATIGEVISGIESLLKPNGVFVFENHYLLDVIHGGQFDTIYHEHLRTYSLKSLIKLFSYYDFTVTDVERGTRYGGNIRVHVTKGKNKNVSKNVESLLKLEEEFGLYELDTYRKFAVRVKTAKKDFMNFLFDMKKEGKTIVGNSCPGRSVTLLNYYGVDSDLLPYIAEQSTSLKLDMYLPGKQIPIVNNEILIQEQPDYVVLLAWHYATPIMNQLKERGLKSNFVIPLPDLKILEN